MRRHGHVRASGERERGRGQQDGFELSMTRGQSTCMCMYRERERERQANRVGLFQLRSAHEARVVHSDCVSFWACEL